MTFVFDINTADKGEAQDRQGYVSGTDIRSVEAQIPSGLVADPLAVPQCTRLQLAREECPEASEVGLDEVYPIFDDETVSGRVFNMIPPPGVTAEFAVNYEGNITYFDAGVRTGGDYGISVRVNNISQRIVRKNILTLWGVPAKPATIAGARGTKAAVRKQTWKPPGRFGLAKSTIARPRRGRC